MFLSHGIKGSTNGRGVFLSTKMGRFIATLDPRLLLMFAVKVLVSKRNLGQRLRT